MTSFRDFSNSPAVVYAFAMTLKKIPLASIDFEDETYRISEDLHPDEMRVSLAEIGQLNPVLLLEGPLQLTIVCGFRRLLALRALGLETALARVHPSTACSRLDAFRWAVFDNLSMREFNPLEKARVLFKLKEACGVPIGALVEIYLPLLSLAPHNNVLRTYLALHSLDPDLRRFFNDGRLTLASVERLSGLSREEQRLFTSLLARIRLSSSRQREVLDLADELAVLRETRAAQIFSRPEIESIAADARLSPFQKGEQIYELFFRWRNPRISRAEEEFRQDTKRLGLPEAVRISPDPHFETPRLLVEFDAGSPERFREIAAALFKAAQTPVLEKLFRVS